MITVLHRGGYAQMITILHRGVVVCLNGSDDDEIHNNHLVISDKGSIRGLGRSRYLQNFILAQK